MTDTEKKALGYIKAITAWGGKHYSEFKDFHTRENQIAFEEWLERQSKANGTTLYRGCTFDESYYNDGNWEVGSVLWPIVLGGESDMEHPAFTLSPLRAIQYKADYQGDVPVLFTLVTKGKYMVDVSPHSFYPEEKEYRPTESARFIITKISGGYSKNIHLEEI